MRDMQNDAMVSGCAVSFVCTMVAVVGVVRGWEEEAGNTGHQGISVTKVAVGATSCRPGLLTSPVIPSKSMHLPLLTKLLHLRLKSCWMD
jgi:hypothetical protein